MVRYCTDCPSNERLCSSACDTLQGQAQQQETDELKQVENLLNSENLECTTGKIESHSKPLKSDSSIHRRGTGRGKEASRAHVRTIINVDRPSTCCLPRMLHATPAAKD